MARLNQFLMLALLAVLSFQLVIASPNIKSGTYRIVSVVDDTPLGVSFTRQAAQRVYVDGPVNVWRVRAEGNNEFRLGVGGYPFTGIQDDKVLAAIYPEVSVTWTVRYAQFEDAYTIELPDTGKGWTVSPDSERANVEIRPIIATLSLPPQYLIPGQLWRFVAVEE